MMTDGQREKMRQEDHDRLIRLEGCVRGIAQGQQEQGVQIKDLYERIHPITQWIGTANSGLKIFSYLGVIVVLVSLLWNGVATSVSILLRTLADQQTQSSVVVDPDAPTPRDQVRRP